MLFGEIIEGRVSLNDAGAAVCSEWLAIPHRFPSVTLDEFVVMPNHMHGILFLSLEKMTPSPASHSLGDVVGAFKSLSTRAVRASTKDVFKVWQRNYYEQIVRDEAMLDGLRHYVRDNPLRWPDDPENSSCPVGASGRKAEQRG